MQKSARSSPLLSLVLLGVVGVVAPRGAIGAALDAGGGGTAGQPPRTPRGLPVCEHPLAPSSKGMVATQGESLEYDVEVLGLDVGTLEVATSRHGSFRGEPVTEYRGQVRVDRLLAALVPLEGAAASLVADAHLAPVQASSRYRWATLSASEFQVFADGGREVAARRRDNDVPSEKRRRFHAPVQDMLSGFYFLRHLDTDASGCTIVFTNGKAYTIWLRPEGRETLETRLGRRETVRYEIRYASDEAKVVKHARLWLGTDHLRIPYRAEGLNSYRPRVQIRRYKPAA